MASLTEDEILDLILDGKVPEPSGKLALELMDKGDEFVLGEDDSLRKVEKGPQRTFERIPEARGFFGSLASGFKTGLMEVGAGAMQLAGEAGEFFDVEGAKEFGEKATQTIKTQRERSGFETEEQPVAGTIGTIAGNVAGFPVGGVGIPAAIAGGVVAGGLVPTTDDATLFTEIFNVEPGQNPEMERSFNAVVGGASGGILTKVLPIALKLVKEGLSGTSALARAAFQFVTKKAPPPGSFDEAGNPTAAFAKTLQDSGIDLNDLDDAVPLVDGTFTGPKPPKAPTEGVAERQARFERQGIPATAGNVTQDFAQQATEQRLLQQASSRASDPLRQRLLEQSEAFKAATNSLVDNLGLPKETGDAIKSGLTENKKLLQTQKNAFYKAAAEGAPEVLDMPIFNDTLVEAFAPKAMQRRIGRAVPGPKDQLDDLLVEFGVDKSDEAVAKFVESGGELTPMTLGNFDDFRQALNLIERSDQTGMISNLTGPIKKALDGEAAEIDKVISKLDIKNADVVKNLKAARATVRTLKTEFSPQAISGRLINLKKDNFTPVTESSKIAEKLLAKGAPIEDLERVVTGLGNSKKGKVALGNLQASVVMDALEAALKAPSRKVVGIETIGGNQFSKNLDKIGDDKLAVIFKNNPAGLKALNDLKQTALDIEPAAGTIPKGSAAVILDVMKRFGRVPGIAALVDVVTFVTAAGADDRAVAKALTPERIKTLTAFDKAFPEIAGAIGVRGILNIEGET